MFLSKMNTVNSVIVADHLACFLKIHISIASTPVHVQDRILDLREYYETEPLIHQMYESYADQHVNDDANDESL